MAHLSIRLLGPFQVMLEGEPVTEFASDKVRALLAYLAVASDRPHRREALAGLLWPDYPESSARATLRNALANLRTAIGDRHTAPPHLGITRQTLQFNPHSDHWLDVTAFTAALEADPATREELADAMALYRGPFLEGFSLPDSAPYEEWLIATREHLGRQGLAALRRLVELHEQDGAYEDALPFARRQVELEPWQEEGHRQVMGLLAQTGHRSQALAQYERCHQLLHDGLGVEPAAETTALYEAIRSGELEPEATITLTERAPKATYTLPSQPTPFVGREEELAGLEALLHDPAARLVTILGPGGIGKTRLAVAAGARIANAQRSPSPDSPAPAFPHGVVFVPLAPLSSVQDMVPAIADALQFRLRRGLDQLLDSLRNKQLLLILDNLEYLLDLPGPAHQGGADLLTDLMAAAPGVKLLVTSRERLQLHGEHAFPIGGLALPTQDLDPSTLTGAASDALMQQVAETYPAIKLFVLTARRAQPHFSLDPDAITRIVQLCRLVDGMPLALELAASWADTLSLDDILAAIRDNLDFLQTQWRDLPPRQRSMRAVFDASWARLGAAEQAVLPRLSVFRGGFTRAAAEQVAMPDMHPVAAARLLSRLVAKSFLLVDPSAQRFQVHELLRQYAAEKLAQDPDHEAVVQDRHSRHFCRWLGPRGADLQGNRQKAALTEIGIELENVRAACLWAAARGHADRINPTLYALGLYYRLQGALEAGEVTFRALADRLSAAVDSMSGTEMSVQWAMARLCAWRSVFASIMGNIEECNRFAHQGLTLLDSPILAGQDSRSERALIWMELGYAVRDTDPAEARLRFSRSHRLYQEIGDQAGMAYTLEGLGRAVRNLRDLKAAEHAVAESLRLRQDLGDEIGVAESMALLGDIALWQGEFETAIGWLRQYHAVREKDVPSHYLSHALLLAGRFEEASTSAAESAALYLDLGQRREAVHATAMLGQCHLHRGDSQAARVQAEDALSLAQGVDVPRGTGMSLGLLGAVALAEGAYEQARTQCQESLTVWQQSVGHPSEFGGELACLALATGAMGYRAEAWQHLRAQLAWAQESQMLMPALFGLVGVARLLADEGEVERAVELYALASTYPFVANSRWFEDVAGREMAAIAASLPPDVARAAQARGQARDLWATAADLLKELSRQPGTD